MSSSFSSQLLKVRCCFVPRSFVCCWFGYVSRLGGGRRILGLWRRGQESGALCFHFLLLS